MTQAPGRMRGDGWIRVEDRLPGMRQKVLAWAFGECRTGEMSFQREDGRWVWKIGSGPAHTRNVTHWMPLPAPPVADGEEGDDG